MCSGASLTHTPRCRSFRRHTAGPRPPSARREGPAPPARRPAPAPTAPCPASAASRAPSCQATQGIVNLAAPCIRRRDTAPPPPGGHGTAMASSADTGTQGIPRAKASPFTVASPIRMPAEGARPHRDGQAVDLLHGTAGRVQHPLNQGQQRFAVGVADVEIALGQQHILLRQGAACRSPRGVHRPESA